MKYLRLKRTLQSSTDPSFSILPLKNSHLPIACCKCIYLKTYTCIKSPICNYPVNCNSVQLPTSRLLFPAGWTQRHWEQYLTVSSCNVAAEAVINTVEKTIYLSKNAKVKVTSRPTHQQINKDGNVGRKNWNARLFGSERRVNKTAASHKCTTQNITFLIR